MFKTIMAIGAGSFIGGISRYLLSKGISGIGTPTFPWGTFVVNVLGCFLAGIVFGLFDKGSLKGDNLKMFLTVGFCGGFTTFSTFIHENYILFSDKNFIHFVVYATLSFAIGLIVAHVGHMLVDSI